MKLLLKRIALRDTYTIGRLYVNGVYVCDTVEDKVRDVNKNGKFDAPKEVKIPSQTAIPYGTFKITFVKSPKFSNYEKYPYTRKYNGIMPWVRNVPHFEGILIHPGSSAASSAGCLIVGRNTIVGRVTDSVATWEKLMDNHLLPAKNRGEAITIEIV